jgi:DNA-binding MarR family transcriptional regulator
MERAKDRLEPEIQDCLEAIGVSLLSEWDLLTFVYRHGPSLTTTDQIAKLVGYEITVVDAALDRLEREMLIERVGPPQGTRLYRMSTSKDAQHRGYLQQVIALCDSRDGRLLAVKLLKPVGRNNYENKSSLEKKGNRLCLKTT